MAIAGPSHFIDLTLDAEDRFLSGRNTDINSKPYKSSIIVIDDTDDEDDDDIQIAIPVARRKSTSTAAPKEVQWSDDEVLILSSSPMASSSKIASVKRCEADFLAEDDEALARRLSREYDESVSACTASNSEEDELLARQLAHEEEESYRKLLETIENNEDGIVFSVVVNAANNTLEDGSPAHPDDLERFQPWKQLCEQTGWKVAKFHWFVNYELEKRFELARDTLEQIMGERPQELQLFHGTAATNVESILRGGFRIGGVGGHPMVNGAAMGHGIYLAADAATSLGYAAGANKIFACRVIPGRTSPTPISTLPPSVHVGSELFECYAAPGNSVYVHRYSSLVLPCYMIEFDRQEYNPLDNLAGRIAGLVAGIRGGAAPATLIPAVPPPLVNPQPQRLPPPRKTTNTVRAARRRPRATLDEEARTSTAPRKRQRKIQPTEDENNEDAAPRPSSSRRGKARAK